MDNMENLYSFTIEAKQDSEGYYYALLTDIKGTNNPLDFLNATMGAMTQYFDEKEVFLEYVSYLWDVFKNGEEHLPENESDS